jgi:hypothetical protein
MPITIKQMEPQPDGFDISFDVNGQIETLSLTASEAVLLVTAIQNALNQLTIWSAPGGMWPAVAVATSETDLGPMLRIFLSKDWHMDFGFPDTPDTRSQLDYIRSAAPQIDVTPEGKPPFPTKMRH